MKRLHAQPITREEQALPPRIVKREGEHAVQPVEHRRAPRLPAVKQHFGIAIGAEDRALGLQLGANLLKIIDFAIVGDGDALVGGKHRLRAAAEIDDRQPAMAEADAGRRPHPRSIRPAMREHVRHRADPRRIDGFARGRVEQPGDPAHQLPIGMAAPVRGADRAAAGAVRPALASASLSSGPSAARKRSIAARGSCPGATSADR